MAAPAPDINGAAGSVADGGLLGGLCWGRQSHAGGAPRRALLALWRREHRQGRLWIQSGLGPAPTAARTRRGPPQPARLPALPAGWLREVRRSREEGRPDIAQFCSGVLLRPRPRQARAAQQLGPPAAPALANQVRCAGRCCPTHDPRTSVKSVTQACPPNTIGAPTNKQILHSRPQAKCPAVYWCSYLILLPIEE